MKVKFKKITETAIIPQQANPTDVGFDVFSDQDIILKPGERALISTGLIMELPLYLECQVRPRSGLALKHGITVLNSPGTIDPDYRKEVGVILINTDKDEQFKIFKGQRIAQFVFHHKLTIEIEEVKKVTDSNRGGFGSTGV